MTGATSIVRIVATAVVFVVLLISGPNINVRFGPFELGSERPAPVAVAKCNPVQTLAKVCH